MGCLKSKEKEIYANETLESFPQHIPTVSYMVKPSTRHLSSDYQRLNQIGEGGYGRVVEVMSTKTSLKRAAKSINTRNMKPSEIEAILQEFHILKDLDHPGIIRIYDVYKEVGCIHIVTELCTGGELFEKIVKQHHLSENAAAKYMFDIVSTIKYLHEAGIVHRDLKPDNILFEDTSENARIKIIDFGTSARIKSNEKLQSLVGTPYYIAPEVIKGEYNEKCDVWSIGVILFIMLSGGPPFEGSSNEDIYAKILSQDLSFSGAAWKGVSISAINLIKRILEKNPNKRISISDLYYDPWIRTRASDLVPEKILAQKSLKKLVKFKKINKLQACTYSFLSHCLATSSELKHIRSLFQAFDSNGDGRLSREEIAEGLQKFSIGIEVNVEEILANCDIDHSGFIDYSEFLTAIISEDLKINKMKMKIAFDAIDTDKSGKISKNELRAALIGITSEESVNNLINEIDKNGDGEIDIEEFTDAMLKL